MSAKKALRLAMIAQRIALARDIPDLASRIAAFAGGLPLASGAIVAGYWPIRGEADPRQLMAALGARGHGLALPRVEGQGLSFRAWRDGDALASNAYGIPEPVASCEAVVPGLILVPLLAFDAAGHRLGYGGGYYDRTLALHRATAAGIAYAGQEVQELFREAHDHGLDMVVTEQGVRNFG